MNVGCLLIVMRMDSSRNQEEQKLKSLWWNEVWNKETGKEMVVGGEGKGGVQACAVFRVRREEGTDSDSSR